MPKDCADLVKELTKRHAEFSDLHLAMLGKLSEWKWKRNLKFTGLYLLLALNVKFDFLSFCSDTYFFICSFVLLLLSFRKMICNCFYLFVVLIAMVIMDTVIFCF